MGERKKKKDEDGAAIIVGRTFGCEIRELWLCDLDKAEKKRHTDKEWIKGGNGNTQRLRRHFRLMAHWQRIFSNLLVLWD